jgi:hypothetical protein
MKIRFVKRVLAFALTMITVASLSVLSSVNAQAKTVSLTGQQIAEKFKSKIGNTVAKQSCLAFVANTFKELGAERDSAECAYEYFLKMKSAKRFHPGEINNIPIGADVFFSGKDETTKHSEHYAGHIGVYVGNGKMVDTSKGEVGLHDVNYAQRTLTYLGWAYHGNVNVGSEQSNTVIANGTYYFINVYSGKRLNAFANAGKGTTDTKITASTADSSPEQKWVVNNASNGTVSIRYTGNGNNLYLDAYQAKNNSYTHLWTKSTSLLNDWYVEKYNTSYIIRNAKDKNLVLTQSTSLTVSGRPQIVIQTLSGGKPNNYQLWSFSKA